MFCENCGEKVSKEDTFCTNCGSPIKKGEANNTTDEVRTEENIEVTTDENQSVEETRVKEEKIEPVSPVETTVSSNIPKENIKKGSTGKVVLIIVAILLVLAAIGGALYFFVFKDKEYRSENSVLNLTSAFENMQKKKSYTTVINGNVLTTGVDKIDASFNWETNLDIENKKIKMNVNLTYNEAEIEVPIYADFNDKNNNYIYFKLPSIITGVDEWQKLSLGYADFDELMDILANNADDSNESTLEEFKEKIKDIDFVKKERSDISGCDYYKIIINEENLKKISEAYEDFDLTDSDIEEMQLKDGFIIEVYVNKKDNYISKINLDMTNYINLLAYGEIEFKKFDISIEYKDIDKNLNITIPSEAKNAKEIDMNELYGGYGFDNPNQPIPGGVIPDDDDDDENYVDDYAITDYGYKVKYNMPEGFEPSSVNDDTFKIYRNDSLRVVMSNYRESGDERFEDIESSKQAFETNGSYKDVVLSEEKELTFNNKKFAYKELSYETSTGSKGYETVICYQLDDNYVYRVKYEKNGSPITESELKLFLDIQVSKK
ncbi:MAG: zinc-ribbon domain-containing protein [Bacilli bacterium]|nr:zinc-ribbon domain-containing protein [Bacilli bacterium]